MGERRWVSFFVEVPPGEDERLLMGARIEVPGWSQDFRGEPFRVTGASDSEVLRVILPDVDPEELRQVVDALICQRCNGRGECGSEAGAWECHECGGAGHRPIGEEGFMPDVFRAMVATQSLLAAMTEGETE